ncbi:hypothetical protein ASPWEDRAFT_106441 [Aspergillus wentii DTO 134E9]|uniref:RNA polymerase I-specific transcription initiation factor RRN6-like protein n=1 Tax=Aspergillus wentii DTO 134E9 TaxID=1073089 RepID=A0A1L9RUI3_ASPWE|nr:uncharacterized protein ASPWEDRAFT_106441 [Aspergillus wentii DTO 134E9]OJJ38582.1 hypothetical protein ASPWEDRAFT_106441 [Aspergillus wentii DTO 134E9]
MNILRVLCNMGTWAQRFTFQKPSPGHSTVLWPNVSVPIHYAGSTKTIVSSPLTATQSSLPENKSQLSRVHPELAASWSFVRNETLSHVITAASEICDPLMSSLFDLGHAVDLENDDSGSRVIPIAVTASGECGNAISFRKIEEDTVELKQETTVWVRIPSVGEAERVEWSTDRAPVRQICFARTVEEKATWMAARFPHSTTVFRPLFHRYPVPMHTYNDGDCVIPTNPRNSRLDANPLIEISNSQTGGFAHADVTFNPWYQKQFAIVDERGNWGLWEISGRHRRNKGNWTAACVKSGALPWLDAGDTQDMDDHPRHDGWAAIEWAGDVNSFIVSDRRCPMLYRMESDHIWPHPIELNLKRKSEWILDVKRSTCNVAHVFILTTSRIFLFDVTPDSASVSGGDTGLSVYPRLSWRHFRDPEDTTLRLSPLFVNEDFYLVLYSRLNHFVLVFQCPNAVEGGLDNRISIPDPFMLDIPSISDRAAGSQTSPNGAQFSTLVFKEVAHLPSSLSKKYYDRSATGLIKLFALDSHLSVRESVYVGPGAKGGEQEQLPGRDILRLKKRYPGVQRKQATQDDFIVDDWDESVLGMGTPTAPDPGSSIVTPLAIPEWTIDCTSIYAVATGKLMAVLSGMIPGHLPEKDFKVSIKELENKISKNDLRDEPTNQTMLEFLGVSPLLEDIDQSARDFERFVSVLTGQNSASQEQLQFIILPRKISPGSTEHMGLDLVNIYDSLVNDWLSNLPHDIASRTRIMKEKVIRKVTADLILSRISIIPRVMGRAKESGKDPGHGNDAKSAMPAGNASGTITQRSLSLPLATESGPGSNIISSFSHIRTDSAPGGVGSSKSESSEDSPGIPYPSLSALAAFNYEQPMSRHVTNMLSHWPPGANPDAYNWQRTVHEFENEHTQRVANSTTPRRRLRKKASQSTVLDSSATVPPVSTVPVVRDWGSQPDNEPPRLRLQSSQARDEDLPMTQIERGIFGGREAGRKPAMKARKKKRAAGF